MIESSAPDTLSLLAPVSGPIVPLAEVPDPTFANKLVGDGVAIDPISETLLAPCDGEVTQLHSAHHALTIRTREGIEVLMHIGLDTVLLKGKGFVPKVAAGDKVKAGDELIGFDASYLVHHAASLLTLMVVTNTEKVAEFRPASGLALGDQTGVLELKLKALPAAPMPQGEGDIVSVTSEPIVILNPAGLHARPAAVLVNNAKRFGSEITLHKGDKGANAKSVVAIMGLEIKQHEKIQLTAVGQDANLAVETLVPLIKGGLGDSIHGVIPDPEAQAEKKPERQKSDDPNVLLGVSASPGLVIGPIYQLRDSEIFVQEEGLGFDKENAKLILAIKRAKDELMVLQDSLRQRADTGKAAIFAAHQELLEDPELISGAKDLIKEGKSASFAWKASFTKQAQALAALQNQLLAARANDIKDIGNRVLRLLSGDKVTPRTFPHGAILIAEDLTPSDTAGLDKTLVAGFCTTGGSGSSHAAILARAMGIPAIAAIEERALIIPNGTVAVLVGEKGELRLNPSAEETARVKGLQNHAEELRRTELKEADMPAVTKDGRRIKVVANIGSSAEAEDIPSLGGEGVGLLRSEFLFLQRADAPGESEQAAVYQTIAKILGAERDLIVRTLDVGGDKPLAYLPLPEELNPFLGVRGIRLSLMEKPLFRSQIRAILSAANLTKLHIMFPMISSLDEFKEAKDMVLEEKAAMNLAADVKIGMMVEIPSAAVMAETLSKEADFFSIGTNDLTQYTLAIDRGHPKLAKRADALHPAVLRLIKKTVDGAKANGKWVGICGGIAGDALAVPVLIGLGVAELSVSASVIPQIKAQVRRQEMGECEKIALEALSLPTAKEVREKLSGLSQRVFGKGPEGTENKGSDQKVELDKK